MGYMDISIGGSDGAADCHHGVVSAVVEVYKRELKNPGNCYNTPGCINVAMSMIECSLEFWSFYYQDGDSFIEDLKKQLDELIDGMVEYKKTDECCDVANVDWHLKEYRAIRRKFMKIYNQVIANDM
jgi:hypothetical protein